MDTNKVKLTKAWLAKVKPNGKLHFIWDEDQPGFGVQVTPAGKLSYVIRYRFDGAEKRKVIGKVAPSLTPEAARGKAKEELSRVALGTDVAKVAANLRAEAPLREAIEEWLTAHGSAMLKPRTAQEYRRMMAKHVLPVLGSKKVSQVARQDVATLHRGLGKPHKDTGDRRTRLANHAMAALSSFFNWYKRNGGTLPAGNPCDGIDKFKEVKRERFLSDEEFERAGRAIAAAEEFSPYARAAILVLMFTGARKQEIMTLKWSYIDIERGLLRLPDSKTGAKVIPLGRHAAEIMGKLDRVEGNSYVFVGGVEGEPYRQVQKVWSKVRGRAGLDDVRLHDLRHSFASVAVAGGASLPILGKALGHTQVATTGRYAHLADNPVREMVEGVGEKLAGLLGVNKHEQK